MYLPVIREGNVFHDDVNVTRQELENVPKGLRIVVGPKIFHRLLAGLHHNELFGERVDQGIDLAFQLDEAENQKLVILSQMSVEKDTNLYVLTCTSWCDLESLRLGRQRRSSTVSLASSAPELGRGAWCEYPTIMES